MPLIFLLKKNVLMSVTAAHTMNAASPPNSLFSGGSMAAAGAAMLVYAGAPSEALPLMSLSMFIMSVGGFTAFILMLALLS